MTTCLPNCLRPCRNTFERLAREAPELLIAWAQTGYGLDVAELSFALEALGTVDTQESRLALERGLEHESPIVREGAVLGIDAAIANHVGCPGWRREGLRLALKRHLNDPSPGVCAAVREALEP